MDRRWDAGKLLTGRAKNAAAGYFTEARRNSQKALSHTERSRMRDDKHRNEDAGKQRTVRKDRRKGMRQVMHDYLPQLAKPDAESRRTPKEKIVDAPRIQREGRSPNQVGANRSSNGWNRIPRNLTRMSDEDKRSQVE